MTEDCRVAIICGGRDARIPSNKVEAIFQLLRLFDIDAIASGCASGVDTDAIALAEQWKMPVHRYPAHWDRFGKSAGPIRNAEMASKAHIVIALPGGVGTENMIHHGRKAGLTVIILPKGKWGEDAAMER